MGVLSNKTRILYGFYDMSGDTYEWEVAQTVGELEKTVLSSTAMEYIPNIVEGNLTFSGYLKVASASTVESRLNNLLNTETENVAVLLDYQTFPSASIVFPSAFNNTVNFGASVGELLTFNGGIRSRGVITRGNTICYSRTASTVGAIPSVQVPSIAATNTGNIFFFLHSFTGAFSSSAVVAIQSSPDNTTFTTNATFTTNVQKSMVAVTSPAYTGSYIRANVTDLGGATSITYSVIVSKN